MAMRAFSMVAILLAGLLPAQGGDAAKPPRWVLDLYPKKGSALQDQSEQLRQLQQIFGQALQVRVLLVEGVETHRKTSPPYEVLPSDNRVYAGQAHLKVDGAIRWDGASVDGFEDAIYALLDGHPDPYRFRQLTGLRNQVVHYVGDGPAVPETATRLVEVAPHWGAAHAWRYRDDLWNRADRATARRHAAEALRTLADRPYSLTVFCDLALRTDRYEQGTAGHIAAAMKRLADADESVVFPWVVWLRAQLRSDPDAVTEQVVEARWQAVAATPRILELAQILIAGPPRLRNLGERALQQAWHFGVPMDEYLLTRAELEVRKGADDRALRELDKYLALVDNQDRNAVAWGLLSRDATLGRFDHAMRRLMQWLRADRGSLSDAEIDTLALAVYGSGDPARALELQTQVIADGDGDPRYVVRQRRYRQAGEAR